MTNPTLPCPVDTDSLLAHLKEHHDSDQEEISDWLADYTTNHPHMDFRDHLWHLHDVLHTEEATHTHKPNPAIDLATHTLARLVFLLQVEKAPYDPMDAVGELQMALDNQIASGWDETAPEFRANALTVYQSAFDAAVTEEH